MKKLQTSLFWSLNTLTKLGLGALKYRKANLEPKKLYETNALAISLKGLY